MKKIAALLLTFSLVLSVLVPGTAEAKTVQKKFTMRVRELKRLTIKNAKKRVVWKTLSGKNKIHVYKGEKKSVFILAKKKGTVRFTRYGGNPDADADPVSDSGANPCSAGNDHRASGKLRKRSIAPC